MHLHALGGFIRQQRRIADLSLRELASLTSVSNAYLSQIERGLHQPSLRVLRAIADALDVTPTTLLTQAGLLDATPPDTPATSRTRPARVVSPAGAGAGAGTGPAGAGAAVGAGPDAAGAGAAASPTEAAIAVDPALTELERQTLTAVYRSYLSRRTP